MIIGRRGVGGVACKIEIEALFERIERINRKLMRRRLSGRRQQFWNGKMQGGWHADGLPCFVSCAAAR